jgi:hypothetical protein
MIETTQSQQSYQPGVNRPVQEQFLAWARRREVLTNDRSHND